MCCYDSFGVNQWHNGILHCCFQGLDPSLLFSFTKAIQSLVTEEHVSTPHIFSETTPLHCPRLLFSGTYEYDTTPWHKGTAASTTSTRIMVPFPFQCFHSREKKSFEAVGLEEAVQTEAGHSPVFALLRLHLPPLLS